MFSESLIASKQASKQESKQAHKSGHLKQASKQAHRKQASKQACRLIASKQASKQGILSASLISRKCNTDIVHTHLFSILLPADTY